MSDTDEQPITLRFSCEAEGEVMWAVSGMHMRERFNEPYRLTLGLSTDDPVAEPIMMLGAAATLTVERGGLQRELCGIIESVQDGQRDRDHLLVTVTIVPALTALGHRRTSRIFQDMTIPDILDQVLQEGLGPFQRSVDVDFLTGDYPTQEYTVQYQETDLSFVSRLMEEHGIVYCFRHADGVETLTLVDDPAAWEDLMSAGNGDGVLPMVMADGTADGRECAREFVRDAQLQPTVARTAVFDWLTPDPAQVVEDPTAADLGFPNGAELGPEREDYFHEEPGTLSGYRSEGLDLAAVNEQVRLRRVVHNRDTVRCHGRSTALNLSPGVKFELLDHPHHELEGQYLVVAVEHSAGDMCIGGEGLEESYSNRIECVPIDLEWRPARWTRRPRIPSMQTATVVGPAGEEIHTDEHGRIKVQFHWDRGGASDEASSCFIRVVQPWAGNGWGFVFLPRIGMEVAVTFIDGDPDRPVVTGCLYNGANAPPYGLPDDKTKSTIKSESSPGGGGFNELRLEDAAGSEEIYIHAQKDFNEEVLNDHNTTVGNNQTNNVDVDQTQTVHGNQSEAVDGNQDMTIGGNRTVHVKGDYEETVDGTETRTVTGDVTETFEANETRDVIGDITETVMGSVTHTITGDQCDTITGSLSQTVTAGISAMTPATYEMTAAAGVTITSGSTMKLVAPAGLTMVAPAGTTTVDSFFTSIGGKDEDLFAWKTAVLSGKLSAVYMAISLINYKIDIVGMKVDVCGSYIKGGHQMELKNSGHAIVQGILNIETFGLIALN